MKHVFRWFYCSMLILLGVTVMYGMTSHVDPMACSIIVVLVIAIDAVWESLTDQIQELKDYIAQLHGDH